MRAYQKAFGGCAVRWAAAVVLSALFVIGTARAEASPWQELQNAIDRADNGGVITLTGSVTALKEDDALTIASGKRLTLDLNGHTLNRGLKDGGAVSPAVYVQEGAILILRDSGTVPGVITGGYRDTGGGIINRGTLIMEGGCVTGNTALDAGGGIANYGTMVLLNGSVTGNTSLGEGGGVYNQAKAHLTLREDAVYGNLAPKKTDIANEGTLTVVGSQPAGTYIEDMPVLKRFIAQTAVLPSAGLLLALLLTVWLDTYLGRERRRMMIVIIVLVICLVIQNYLEYRLAPLRGSNALRLPLSVLGYSVRPVILLMFLIIVKPGRYRIAWALIGVNAAVYATAFFSGIAFHFTTDAVSGGHFISGPLRHTCTVVSAVLLAWLLFLTIRQFHPQTRRESWIPIFVTVLITGSVLMDFNVRFDEQPISFLTMAIIISCVFYYIWLHLQLVREHEQALRAEQRIQIMRTQIQPHFLYNTIATFKALCRKDPQQAAEVAEKFGAYLRQNLDSLDMPGRIPFEKELEHTKLYADIEMVRFDNIRVEYDIEDSRFTVPPLTLQPMVENAIRHGVRGREEGMVRVHTRKTAAGHQIIVQDNGKGFDPQKAEAGEGQHLGIRNVRGRIESMCGGTVTIQSAEGIGTTVTITIPDTEEKQ